MITQPGPCVFALWSLCNKQPWDSKTAFTPWFIVSTMLALAMVYPNIKAL
jgi:hypothetical protein